MWDAPGTDLSGLGAAASSTTSGIFVKVEGKPYFVHVLAGSMEKPGQFDAAMGESVARKLKL